MAAYLHCCSNNNSYMDMIVISSKFIIAGAINNFGAINASTGSGK